MAARKRAARRKRHDQDSPWKELIRLFFPQLIELIHPELHEMIDWQRGYEFLDAELQRIAPKSRTGRQTVDKLVRVYFKDGMEQWILIHIEVQSRPDRLFPERTYTYEAALWLYYPPPNRHDSDFSGQESALASNEVRAFAGRLSTGVRVLHGEAP
jgi:hypothetical protein